MTFLYLISNGEYSSYGVKAIAVSEKRIPLALLEEWEKEFKGKEGSIETFLTNKGLQVVYAAGEFWTPDYGEDNPSFTDDVRVGEENAFRIGLG